MSGTCFECKFMRQRTDLEPCEHCTNVFAITGVHPSFQSRKPITNADRFRAKTDEELARWIALHPCLPNCLAQTEECFKNSKLESCARNWLNYLKEEVTDA